MNIIFLSIGNRDPIQAADDPNYTRNSRLNNWVDINEDNIKLFMAHVIVMGLIRKPNVTKYWSRNPIISTPFFRKYMGRMNFEYILSNIHVSDNTIASTEPLVKLKPFLDMCDRNFLHVYKSNKNISVDETSCKWKGHFSHKVYNPRKPSKFHIKLYQVCEADLGYVIACEVYTGKVNNTCIKMNNPIDPTVNDTTRLVLGLLEKGQLLDKGYNVFTDNYYASPELLCKLFYRQTFGTGTVRSNRKNMPKAVVQAKLEKGESCFCRNGELLCIKWCDKHQVTVLTTIDDAIEIAWKHDQQGNA